MPSILLISSVAVVVGAVSKKLPTRRAPRKSAASASSPTAKVRAPGHSRKRSANNDATERLGRGILLVSRRLHASSNRKATSLVVQEPSGKTQETKRKTSFSRRCAPVCTLRNGPFQNPRFTSCRFGSRDFVLVPSKWGPFGTYYFPSCFGSGPVILLWRGMTGGSARMNYKPGKSREKAKEWPRRTVTGAPETGAQLPPTPPPSGCGAAAAPPSASLPSSSD